MKSMYRQCTLFFLLCSVSFCGQVHSEAKVIHIATSLSDKLNYRFEQHLSYAYNQLGYKVLFEPILTARARKMLDADQLDAIMIAEKEIEQVHNDILRIPVMLAKGSLMLYCNKRVKCKVSELNNSDNIVGVITGNSMSGNYMRQMRASTHTLRSSESLGNMLIKERLDYVLLVFEEQFGNVSGFDASQYQKVEVFRSEGYHYVHKKYEYLLPDLTKALQLAVEKLGPLVKSDPTVNK